MNIIFNTELTNDSSVLSLTNDGLNRTYQIVCSSIKSRPDVALSIFDSDSLLSLSNGQNTIKQGSCISYNICTQILQINFQLKDNSFNNMKSLTCLANSTDTLIPLVSTISRNVSVKLVGNK
jgi:hypothetical protein